MGTKEEFEMEHLMLRFIVTAKLEQMVVHFFITFMVISRCMRTLMRIFEDL